MNIEQVKEVYFLGIGGIGMSALARFFKIAAVRSLVMIELRLRSRLNLNQRE